MALMPPEAGTITTSSEHDDGEDALPWRAEGGVRCRGNHNNSGGLLYHLDVGGHVAVFQGIDGAHYTVLTVVGGGLGSHTKCNTHTGTH